MDTPDRIIKNESTIIEEYGPIGVIKINRPERLNAFGEEMNGEIEQYLRELSEGDYRIRAVILTGEGRAFCAGGNVKTFPGANLDRRQPPWRPSHPEHYAINHMRWADVPIIGAINGYCLGMGLGLALATDLRICSQDAMFQVMQIKRGITGDYGVPHFLPKSIGTHRAMELMLTGRRFGADEAKELGLVLDVVPNEELMDRAFALAGEVIKGPPLGLAATKRLVYMNETDDLQRVQDLTGQFVKHLFVSDDGIEGVKSFMERREPNFQGR